MPKKELPILLTLSQTRWGIRYLLFEMVFLGPILQQFLAVFWPSANSAHLNFLYFLINFLAVGWIFRHYWLDSLKYTCKHWKRTVLTAVLGYPVYSLLSTVLGIMIQLLFPDFFNVNDSSIAVTVQDHLLLTGIGTVLLVPIVEETLFRGLVFGLLHRRSRFLAYLLSALVFCAIHVVGYIGYYEPLHLLLCFIQYLPAGLILGWAYEFSGSIYAPTLIHMVVNTIGILSMR